LRAKAQRLDAAREIRKDIGHERDDLYDGTDERAKIRLGPECEIQREPET